MIITGSTPTFTMNLPENITEVIENICFAFTQEEPAGQETEDAVVEKGFNDFHIDSDNAQLSVTLTQEDTLRFKAGTPVWYQLKILTSGGDILHSQIWQDEVLPAVCREVLK